MADEQGNDEREDQGSEDQNREGQGSEDQGEQDQSNSGSGDSEGSPDSEEYPGIEDFSKEGDKITAPEGEFSADDKGFDGTPVEQILEERKERLSEDNRPDHTEVSNAGREFDGEKGMFTDEDGFEDAEKKFSLDET